MVSVCDVQITIKTPLLYVEKKRLLVTKYSLQFLFFVLFVLFVKIIISNFKTDYCDGKSFSCPNEVMAEGTHCRDKKGQCDVLNVNSHLIFLKKN